MLTAPGNKNGKLRRIPSWVIAFLLSLWEGKSKCTQPDKSTYLRDFAETVPYKFFSFKSDSLIEIKCLFYNIFLPYFFINTSSFKFSCEFSFLILFRLPAAFNIVDYSFLLKILSSLGFCTPPSPEYPPASPGTPSQLCAGSSSSSHLINIGKSQGSICSFSPSNLILSCELYIPSVCYLYPSLYHC